MTNFETWMPEARKIAYCVCKDLAVDDPKVAEGFSRVIAGWMESGAEAQRNADYYRSLLVRCGNAFGEEARTADDGTVNDEVLVAKVPELVERMAAGIEEIIRRLNEIKSELEKEK